MKKICQLLAAFLTVLLLTLPCAAADEIALDCAQSPAGANPGDLVTLRLSLAGYTGGDDLIRGLQVTVTQIDPAVLQVESCRSLIEAPDVPENQNRATWSEADGLVKLVYAPLTPAEDTVYVPLDGLMEITFRVADDAGAASTELQVRLDVLFQSGPVSKTETATVRIGEATHADGLAWEDGELWYYVGGEKALGAGLIEIDGEYYYIGRSGAAVRGTDYYVSKTNDLKPAGMYTFGPDGKMVIKDDVKNGLVREEDGLWYYVGGLRTHAGLICLDGDYYYVKSNGAAVTGQRYYVSNTNGLLPRAMYTFDADGRMTDVPVVKNGLYEENGRKYYYVDDVKTHAGLIEIDGAYYYINSSGYAVSGCDYFVSNTNGFVKPGTYHFNEDGTMVVPEQDTRTGVFEENGELVYYVNGEKTHAGLIEWEGHYYYIKSNCTAVRDCDYYVSNTNGLMPRGTYHFDADGHLVP